jgi:hypothetical protein
MVAVEKGMWGVELGRVFEGKRGGKVDIRDGGQWRHQASII